MAAVAIAALAAAIGRNSSAATQKPIVIGWAYDSTGEMAPFDGPALAAAKIRVEQINAKGGSGGRRSASTPATRTATTHAGEGVRAEPARPGADIIFVTCDVDFATPVVQESINRGKLAVAPCIGTDQMGPKRFGKAKGKLAFSFGNVAQDEGSAMAEYAIRRGLADGRPRHEHAARLLQERRPGVREALHAARRQDRRPGELRDRREQRPDRGQPAEPAARPTRRT